MALRSYLPSTQFIVIVSSIALSGGLVALAQQFTNQSGPQFNSLSATLPTNAPPTGDWLQALHAIEGDKISLVSGASQSSTTQTLLGAAQSSNVTDTVARTLLIALSQAKSQGLGSDIPTQEKLIAEAAARIGRERGAPPYSQNDIIIKENSSQAMKSYGNEVVRVITRHSEANFSNTILVIGLSLETADPAKLKDLEDLQKEHRALAKDLLAVPTPSSLWPLHLKIVNNFSLMADTYDGLGLLFTDPLLGLASFELYQGLNDETARVFTSVAQQFDLNGILFNKDEPGIAWSLFLSSSKQ
ncbi:MAG: hypothetical protein G01um101456_627 [Parcubacteria group bacterium Gr01-1014_56]|nr:MAG: hypothetical protein G01um101456_627 [Parcubacteria group bacterium Gr01-1014_56]